MSTKVPSSSTTRGKQRLARLLDLVPYLLARPGIRIADAAEDLGVSQATLRDDLQLLFVCGLPGYGPGDLIDMSLDDDTVTIIYDAGMNRPLKLTSDEAFALLVALRAISEVPGLANGDVVSSAMAKLEKATGGSGASSVQIRTHANPAIMNTVSGGLQRRHALQLTYYSASRDALTQRVVDPIRLLLFGGVAYLQAWCRSAQGVRLFHINRIDACVELPEPATVPAAAQVQSPVSTPFLPSSSTQIVRLHVGPRSHWITEYYPCERVIDQGDGRWIVELRVTNLAWARRLAMSLGQDVTVLEPLELAEDIRRAASAALARYELQPVGAMPIYEGR